MSDKKINPEHLYNTLAGKLARKLDAMDSNPNDGQIEASVWNEFVSDKGGKTIRESIDIGLAMNSITTYCVREGAKDGGKTGNEKAQEWDVGLDVVISGQNNNANILNEVTVIDSAIQDNPEQEQISQEEVVEEKPQAVQGDSALQQIVVVPPVIPTDNTYIPQQIEKPLQPADTTKVQTPRERSRKIDNNDDGTQTITRLDKNGNVKKSRVALSWKDIGKISATSVKDFFKGMVCDDDGKVNGWKVAGTVAAIVGIGAACYFATPLLAAGLVHLGVGATAATFASNAILTTALLSPMVYNGVKSTYKGGKVYYNAQSKEEAEQGMKEQMDGIVELASIPVLGKIFKFAGKGFKKLGVKNPGEKLLDKQIKKKQAGKPESTSSETSKPEGADAGKPESTDASKPESAEASKPEGEDAGKASAGGETPKTETPAENKNRTKTNIFGVTKEFDAKGNLIKKSRKTLFHGRVVEEFDANGKLISKTYKKHGLKVTDEYEYVNNEKNLKKRHIWSDINENQIFKTEEYGWEDHNRVVTTTEYKYDADGNRSIDKVVKDTYRPNSDKLLKREGTTENGTYTVDYDINEIPTKATSELKDGTKYIETEYKDGHFTKRRIERPGGKVEEHVYTLTDEGVYDWVNAKDGSPIENVSVESETGKPEGAGAGKSEDAGSGKPESASASESEGAEASKPESTGAADGETPKVEPTAENKTPTEKTNIFGTKKVYNPEGKVVQKSRKRLFGGEKVKNFDDKGNLIGKSKTYKDMFGHKVTEEYDYTSGKKVLKKKTFWEHSNEKQISSTEEYNMDGENKVVTTTEYYGSTICRTYTDTYKPNSSKPFKRVGQSDNEAYTIEYNENGFPTKRTGKVYDKGNVVDDYTETYRPNSDKVHKRTGKAEDHEYTREYDENDNPIINTLCFKDGNVDVYTDYDANVNRHMKCTSKTPDGKVVYYELEAGTDGKYSWVEVPKPAEESTGNPFAGAGAGEAKIEIPAGKFDGEAPAAETPATEAPVAEYKPLKNAVFKRRREWFKTEVKKIKDVNSTRFAELETEATKSGSKEQQDEFLKIIAERKKLLEII